MTTLVLASPEAERNTLHRGRNTGPNGGGRVTRADLCPRWIERWRRHKAVMLASRGRYVCWPAPARAGRTYAWSHRPTTKLPDRRSVALARAVVAYETGETPAGLVVMHECDRPGCCNPDHLDIGTQAENQADMAAKGRSRRGRRLDTAAVEAMVEVRRRRWAVLIAAGGDPFPHLRRGLNPRSVPVEAPDGCRWPSARAAADDLGMTGQGIAHRCRTGWRGWRWADPSP
jgi:HNH endonuclease